MALEWTDVKKWFDFKQMKADKQEWFTQQAQVKQLPEDYQIVFEEVQKYLWQFAGGDGMDMVAGIYDLIDFFEEGAANKVPVLELVGEDVAAFAENALHEMQAKLWTDSAKQKVNDRVAKRLAALDK
jgi:DNA-binding ferritin-like protein (Dps family)